jgi:hypothetical protein
MRIVPFEAAHLAAIQPGRFEALACDGIDPALIARAGAVPGPALTIVSGARVLGAAGLVPLWRGVAGGWLYASDELRARPVALHRAVLRALIAAERNLGLHRIQIAVHAEFGAAQAWAERLGFAPEGAMPGYGPNGDTYLRYARVTHVHRSADGGDHGRDHAGQDRR